MLAVIWQWQLAPIDEVRGKDVPRLRRLGVA
jgi:hypothetical protein